MYRYRRRREMLVERTGVARLPTKWGTFTAYSYTSKLDGIEHIAMVKVTLFDVPFVFVISDSCSGRLCYM